MKQLHITLIALLSWAASTIQAQDALPQNYSIILGGGLTLPHVEGNRDDFFSKNGNRVGYDPYRPQSVGGVTCRHTHRRLVCQLRRPPE